ncbi:hypothetical protein CcaverHIS002_0602100 [Cutaneotrichosporon cavernicola]|uniref:UAS domain-containing protein n=1 Tax=Cutaneotrichosporon cavernicola TaxID=279322 RepID=A0AA48L891_9TREE|nr:uncharacterized protein CcaverHIS019_0601600 [Cutaneotrichosporon cavernicola]BEI85923.1 hypothetical protein CcaverHIS002_0602100 [Cutaneotrichosporon cavernicola]BEI93701.1 hypothetical protein CcaverHIS019_0601600 [Cutaneotrichosporon cavernicola]BEJ01478.1 hypothetical protein CcaverHIS631_0601600 [Cutaneotrichosporon cavernicola]BEJ09244.1 hypothetical protein CcaverHIS641_0601590 [Cutaneotrichosporon cavernicola]
MSRSPEQTDALQQLWAITASETDAARTRDEHILRENNWDIQRAIDQIFGGGGRASAPTDAGPSRKEATEGAEVDNLAPIPPRPGARRISGNSGARRPRPGQAGLGLWDSFAWPFSFLASLITSAWYFFIRTFVPLSLLPHLPRFLLPPPERAPPSGPRDPTTSALRFVRELEALTGASPVTGSLPDFYIGSYRDFLSGVRREGRVGLITLVSSEHDDDPEFKRDVLADPDLTKALKEHDIAIWAADTSTREGFMAAETLQITTYPALTFVSLLPTSSAGGAGGTPRLTILTTLQGPPSTTTSTSAILQTLTTAVLPRTSTFLARLRRERLALEETRHLRDEQDRALREAERKDRDRLLAARAQAELERAQRERAAREQELKEKALTDRREWRRYARKHLLAPSAGPTRVALRTPLNSDRNVRQFTPGPSTLPLFIYAETLLIAPEDDPESDPDTPPAGYEHAWGFRLVTSFPRREIELVETGGEAVWDQIKGAGGALFAEKIAGSGWCDSERASLAGDSSDDEILSDSD